MFILTGMVSWDVLLRLGFDDFVDKFKSCGHRENLIHDLSRSILTRIVNFDCYTSPYIKSHFIIHTICQKKWNNSTSR